MSLYFLILSFITWILCLSEQQNIVSLMRGKPENNAASSTTQELPQKRESYKI